MSEMRWESRPELERPVLLMAYRGWNDAGEAATRAVGYLAGQLGAERFAALDPEEYYDFTQARPITRPIGQYRRELTWPSNEFLYARGAGGRDIVFFVGTEPHLRWRGYGETLVALVRELGITEVLGLGALLADTPHTRPVPLSGGASTPAMGKRMKRLGIESSGYEGPTGMLGVFGVMLSEARVPNGSVWAAVPHYISASPNPRAAAALAREVARLWGLDVPLGELEGEAAEYEAQVAAAVESSPEAQQFIRQLEQDADEDEEAPEQNLDAPPAGTPGEPFDPSQAEGVIRSVEEFFRSRSRGDEPES